jgi:hypothetical protein
MALGKAFMRLKYLWVEFKRFAAMGWKPASCRELIKRLHMRVVDISARTSLAARSSCAARLSLPSRATVST